MDPSFWDSRYSRPGYFYGTSPDAFVAASVAFVPPGPVLCLAEGEGRNAVFFAQRGHPVTAMDQSAIGLAKAAQLAANHNVSLTTEVADLSHFSIQPNFWSAIVATFVHLPPPLRRTVHARVAAGLRPGGVFLFEAYSPRPSAPPDRRSGRTTRTARAARRSSRRTVRSRAPGRARTRARCRRGPPATAASAPSSKWPRASLCPSDPWPLFLPSKKNGRLRNQRRRPFLTELA